MEIEDCVEIVIQKYPDKWAQARDAHRLLDWFVGQVMVATQGRANPAFVFELLEDHMEEDSVQSTE